MYDPMSKILTPFGTEADGHTPFETEALSELRFHVSYDLGGVRFSGTFETETEARASIAAMDPPKGYSSHSATLSEWANRAVDGKLYLRRIARWWFGELVDEDAAKAARAPLPACVPYMLDSDGPDYDPDLYVALLDA